MQGTNWVKCSNKMPEVGKPVIVKLGAMLHIMHISDFDGKWDDGEFLSGVGLENIKYWHELPPMPEGEWWTNSRSARFAGVVESS
nr:DUF551 domain-containing protein [Providencia sp. PROV024]